MFRKGICLLFSSVFLFCVACGSQREKSQSGQMSVYNLNLCFTEDGVVYQNPQKGAWTGYFDYKTGGYMPLCAKSNCLHDSLECKAVYLNKYAEFIGRIGDKWYYYVTEGWEGLGGFHSCDLDGGNDKIIGSFPYSRGDGVVLFYGQTCVLSTWDAEFDEETGEASVHTSGIYAYHLETGKWEALCPEKKDPLRPCYTLSGKYGENLLYTEWDGDKSVLKQMNLESGEVTEPLGDIYVSGAEVSDNFLIYWFIEQEEVKMAEWNMETGEQKEFQESAGQPFWSQDLKTATEFSADFSDRMFWTYQYQDDGTRKLIRQGQTEEVFLPIARSGNLLLGRMQGKTGGFSVLACMEEEDFLAGKTNWTVVTEEL